MYDHVCMPVRLRARLLVRLLVFVCTYVCGRGRARVLVHMPSLFLWLHAFVHVNVYSMQIGVNMTHSQQPQSAEHQTVPGREERERNVSHREKRINRGSTGMQSDKKGAHIISMEHANNTQINGK